MALMRLPWLWPAEATPPEEPRSPWERFEVVVSFDEPIEAMAAKIEEALERVG